MENETPPQSNEQITSSTNIVPIVLSVLITALVVGGTVYAWQRSALNQTEQLLQTKINTLQNQVDELQTTIEQKESVATQSDKPGKETTSSEATRADTSDSIANVDVSKIRPEIKTYIDELYDSEITIKDTTDSIEVAKKRLPNAPKVFKAGRYKVVFNNDNDKKVMIFQTEEIVGHYTPVTPGKTDVGGYVEIQKNPEMDNAEGVTHTTKSLENQNSLNDYNDLKLSDNELDYLIRTLYKKFEKPMVDSQANSLNNVKDYALAIMFSEKEGITEYHNQLVKELN